MAHQSYPGAKRNQPHAHQLLRWAAQVWWINFLATCAQDTASILAFALAPP